MNSSPVWQKCGLWFTDAVRHEEICDVLLKGAARVQLELRVLAVSAKSAARGYFQIGNKVLTVASHFLLLKHSKLTLNIAVRWKRLFQWNFLIVK